MDLFAFPRIRFLNLHASSPYALYNSCSGFQCLFSLLRLQLFLLFPLPLLVAPQYASYCFSKIEDRPCNRSCASCSLAASYILKVLFVLEVKAQPNARNIFQHCWIVLWDVVKELAKRAQHPKMLQQKFDHFQSDLDPTPSNILQHLASGWPSACNTLRATMLQDVALKCCVRLAGPLVIKDFAKPYLKRIARNNYQKVINVQSQGAGGGGYSGILVTGMCE